MQYNGQNPSKHSHGQTSAIGPSLPCPFPALPSPPPSPQKLAFYSLPLSLQNWIDLISHTPHFIRKYHSSSRHGPILWPFLTLSWHLGPFHKISLHSGSYFGYSLTSEIFQCSSGGSFLLFFFFFGKRKFPHIFRFHWIVLVFVINTVEQWFWNCSVLAVIWRAC